jgi:hypothetical protein
MADYYGVMSLIVHSIITTQRIRREKQGRRDNNNAVVDISSAALALEEIGDKFENKKCQIVMTTGLLQLTHLILSSLYCSGCWHTCRCE